MLQACPGFFSASEGDHVASSLPKLSAASDIRVMEEPMELMSAKLGEETCCSTSRPTIAKGRFPDDVEGVMVAMASSVFEGSLHEVIGFSFTPTARE